jgi:hypothetical protein
VDVLRKALSLKVMDELILSRTEGGRVVLRYTVPTKWGSMSKARIILSMMDFSALVSTESTLEPCVHSFRARDSFLGNFARVAFVVIDDLTATVRAC